MLTDSRCCWQYWALSISCTYNSEKDILKHGFRASNTNFFTSTFLSCLAFSVYEVRLACQSCSLNKPNMQLTNYPNGFINTKSHTCKRETCSQAGGGGRGGEKDTISHRKEMRCWPDWKEKWWPREGAISWKSGAAIAPSKVRMGFKWNKYKLSCVKIARFFPVSFRTN